MHDPDDARRGAPAQDETLAGIRELIDSRLALAVALEGTAASLRDWAASAQHALDLIGLRERGDADKDDPGDC